MLNVNPNDTYVLFNAAYPVHMHRFLKREDMTYGKTRWRNSFAFLVHWGDWKLVREEIANEQDCVLMLCPYDWVMSARAAIADQLDSVRPPKFYGWRTISNRNTHLIVSQVFPR